MLTTSLSLNSFRQGSYSTLRKIVGEDGRTVLGPDGKPLRRWVNDAAWKGYTPVAYHWIKPTKASKDQDLSDEDEEAEDSPLDDAEDGSRKSRHKDPVLNDQPVPTQPSDAVAKSRNLDATNKAVLQKLEKAFEQEPIWSRITLLNHMETEEERVALLKNKQLIPLVAYQIVDGPYKDALVRHGYDPRADPEARFAQRVAFRTPNRRGQTEYRRSKKITKHYGSVAPSHRASTKSPSVARSLRFGPPSDAGTDAAGDPNEGQDEREAGEQMDMEDAAAVSTYVHVSKHARCCSFAHLCSFLCSNSHIFDGLHTHPVVSTFFLRDITDPQIREMIYDESENAILEQPDVSLNEASNFLMTSDRSD